MPVLYNTDPDSAPSSSTLSCPWICGAVLVMAVLLFRHRRGKFKDISTITATGPPCRRSYTRTSTVPILADEFSSGADPNPHQITGIKLNEEVIIAAEGWRRHTRVYGGGVCRACVESERQTHLMDVEMDM